MEKTYAYRADDFTATLPVAEYMARFRDVPRFLDCCRQCRNFGKSWACPPYDFDVDRTMDGYESAFFVAVRITPAERIPIGEAGALLLPERKRLERRLLELEKESGGRMFGFTGVCSFCPEGTCTRPSGEPCRHPELVRPSLEACGFNVAQTSEELLGLPMVWSNDGFVPAYLVLVGCLFHNQKTIEWKK